MPIDKIIVGPYYRNGLGRLRDLQQSIARDGLIDPVPVTTDGRLIVGGRRLAACRNLGWTDIPVRIVNGTDELIEAVRADMKETVYSKPMAASELIALGMQIEEIERPYALVRRSEGAIHKTAMRRRQSRDVAADAVGMTHHYYTQIWTIALAASGQQTVPGGWTRTAVEESWKEYSRELLDLADRVWGGEQITTLLPSGRHSNLTIGAIYSRWSAERLRRYPSGLVKEDTYFTTVAPRVGQRKALTAAMQTLTGLCHGFASIDILDPATTTDEAASCERDLAEALKTLRDLHNKIKEYVNATR